MSFRRVVKALAWLATTGVAWAQPIDRPALIARHDPIVRTVDYESPLTVGNGGFAFTADVTGLQTFGEAYYQRGIPLETLSRWCWVADENPQGYTLADANRDYTLADGRVQPFPTNASTPAGEWLRKNPRDQPLGVLQLEWDKPDGTPFVPTDVEEIDQRLDLWVGVITSRYELGGIPVEVTTACDPGSDTIAVRIRSQWVRTGQMRVRLAFPRGHDPAVKNTPALDWSAPESHRSELQGDRTIERTIGGTKYFVCSSRALHAAGPHVFKLEPERARHELAFTLRFGQERAQTMPTVADVTNASAAHWAKFWRTAGVLDLSGSTNPLAAKLERRVVLSQYLTAVQLAGDVPPQESGLTAARGTENITPR